MEYIRINEGLKSYKLIPITDDVWNHVPSPDVKDYYTSIYRYNDNHYQQWKKTGSVAGIKDVVTSKLVFDFDSVSNLDEARKDTTTLVSRLISYGVLQDTIQVCFTGSKGFSVEIDTNQRFSPEEFKSMTFELAKGLKTFDTTVNDPNRIFRLMGTKNLKSGLYKFPLSINQLAELPIKDIVSLAQDWNNFNEDIVQGWGQIELPEPINSFRKPKQEKKKETIIDLEDFDLSKKPKWISPHKYALQEGFFIEGERNTAFMVLASTYKNQGFAKEIVYRMLKGVAEKQSVRNNMDRYPDEELWNNVVNIVFSASWKGGTYSYDNTPLLQAVGQRLGLPKDKTEDQVLIPIENITSTFKRFATEIDKNTIKLGIDSIDTKVRVTTSMAVGLLAGPGSGKTSLSLGILNHNSMSNIPSLFFSLDMGAPLVYQRLIQKHLGYSDKKIFDIYQKNDTKSMELIEKTIADNYKNVKFCFRSGLNIEDIRNTIVQHQETTGEKIKLVVIDYLETISGPYSDATANSGYIAQSIKDIANDLELTVLVLLQPQKGAGDPSEELMSYRQIKGSSQIEQALSVIFTLWRPGFSPVNPEEDKYASIAVVKNRMGSLAKFDFQWTGMTGALEELDEYQKDELKELVARRTKEKLAKDLI